MAVDTHSNSPLANVLCPLEIFTGVKRRTNIKEYHIFGCPTHVLNFRLCSGGGLPKCNPCARRGIYIVVSPEHTSNVSLVYNTETEYVSPQYHVVYDDDFTSVNRKSSGSIKNIWEHHFKISWYSSPDDNK